jgi:3-oxoadipate enol-lactonase
MQHVSVSNATIGVVVQGKGPPLVLVHGFPFNHAMWQAQIGEFSKTHRVLAPDLRGFGESTVTAGSVSLEDFADDIQGLLLAAVVNEPIIFCGLSMGGYVGWQFFRKYRAQLRAMILCDTRAVGDTPEAAEGRRKLADKVTTEGTQAVLEAMLPRLVSPQTVERRPQALAELRSIVLRNNPGGVAAALRGLATRPDCTSLLSTVDVPALLICGEDDAISSPAEMKAMAAAIPGAHYVEVPEAGHMTAMENPQAFNAAVSQFLRRLAT